MIKVVSCFIFICCVLVGSFFVKIVIENTQLEKEKRAQDTANFYGYSLERQLDRSLSATISLAFIIQQNNQIENFNALAADMIQRFGGISSLQLAPKGIITNIYPLKGNEKAIGHDLLNHPRSKIAAHNTLQSKQLTLSGPLDLIQGGKAVIGRYPVFITNKISGKSSFWGFTTALIRMDKLYKDSNLLQLQNSSFHYSLSRLDPVSGDKILFLQSDNFNPINSVTSEINIPNGKWILTIAYEDVSIFDGFFLLISLFTVFVSFALAILLHYSLKQAGKIIHINEKLKYEINQRVLVEQKIEQENSNLEKAVLSRTEELQQAYDELKELDSMKEDFSATVSHELRTPLASILGYAETIADCDLNQDQLMRCVNIIISESERLGKLIDDILDMSSLASGMHPFYFQKHSLEEVIHQAINSVSGLLSQKNNKIEYIPLNIVCELDQQKMVQVLVNLLGNAIKFAHENTTIKIVTIQNNDDIEIKVQNQGSQIESNRLKTIFERFRKYREKHSSIVGTGLGLSIATEIIKAHKGKIWAENEPQGVSFNFTLPL